VINVAQKGEDNTNYNYRGPSFDERTSHITVEEEVMHRMMGRTILRAGKFDLETLKL